MFAHHWRLQLGAAVTGAAVHGLGNNWTQLQLGADTTVCGTVTTGGIHYTATTECGCNWVRQHLGAWVRLELGETFYLLVHRSRMLH